MKKVEPTTSQRLIWFDQMIKIDSAKYNIGGYTLINGPLNIEKFQKTIRLYLASQEVFQTRFTSGEKLISYITDSDEEYQIEIIDFSDEHNQNFEVEKWMATDFAEPFDVDDGVLYRFKLFKISSESYVWYAKIHHIISDGWSFKLLLNHTAEIYSALMAKKPLELQNYKFSDYAVDDSAYLISNQAEIDRKFWMSKFSNNSQELFKRIPYHLNNSHKVSGSHTLNLSSETKAVLQGYSDSNRCSIFHIIISALLLYFSRTRQQNQICVSFPVLNRSTKNYKVTSGVFMNLLALNLNVDPDLKFKSLLSYVKREIFSSLKHQKYQYGQLVKELNYPIGLTLYDIRISYEDFEFTSKFGDLSVKTIALSNYDENDKLAIYLRDYNDEGLDIRFVYHNEFFSSEDITSISDSFSFILDSLSTISEKLVKEISIISKKQLRDLLLLSRGSYVERPRLTFMQIWENVVSRCPNNIALSTSKKSYTYSEFAKNVKKLTQQLTSFKKDWGNKMIVILPRNEFSIMGILATIFSGITYIPIEEDCPTERLSIIIADSGCRLMLISGINNSITVDPSILVLKIENLLSIPVSKKGKMIVSVVEYSNPFYIIYTSGTTGKPKGVKISQESVIDYIMTFVEHFALTENDVVLHQSSISFDTSVEEIFPILSVGGRLHILEDRRDFFAVKEALTQQKITILSTNPYLLNFLNNYNQSDSLRLTISGGDVLRYSFIDRLLKNGAIIYNTYGPTESTVCATFHRVKLTDRIIPIGKPIFNRDVYILDKYFNLQPIGVSGEIYIAGQGLSTGYLNNDDLTNQNFFSYIPVIDKRVYKTGDNATMRPNGDIIFNGRSDNQLNFRGFRIEASEIESFITREAFVKDCIVDVKKVNEADPILVAFISYVSDQRYNSNEWKTILKDYLPQYMIPEIWIDLKEMPLLPNGKIDRSSLYAFTKYHSQNVTILSERPFLPLEFQLAEIWQIVINRTVKSVDQSFFDLGGNSLNIMQLINHYSRFFEVKLSVQDLFHHTTISAHAELLGSRSRTEHEPLLPVAHSSDYAVSDGQRRLWVLSQLEDSSRAYHLAGSKRLEGTYDSESFDRSITALIGHYEILRTVFRENSSGELRQVVLPVSECGFRFRYTDYRGHTHSEVMTYLEEEATGLFDLSNGPLLRAGLLRTGESSYLFHYNMHHIISDGWSMELLGRQVMSLYDSYKKGEVPDLPPLRIQYKDYASWQQSELSGSRYSGHRSYWLDRLSGELPVLMLPSDHARPAVQSHNGHGLSMLLGQLESEALQRLCSSRQSTLFMGLLGVLNTLLYRYTGQDDLLIGSPVAGRDHSDLEDQIGFYINTLVLRTHVNGQDSFVTLLERIREDTLSAYSHQQYPFDRLVEDLDVRRDMSRSPVFDVMMVLQNQAENMDSANGAVGQIIDEGVSSVKLDLLFSFSETTSGLGLYIQFNTDIYNKDRMSRLLDHFRNLLISVVDTPDAKLDDLEYVGAEERDQLVRVFNSTVHVSDMATDLVSLFREQVLLRGSTVALIHEGRSLSYQELETETNRLGSYLRTVHGVGRGDLISVVLPRSEWMIISLLSIIKLGCAYVPVDPSNPSDRISYILSDSGCSCVIDSDFLSSYLSVRDTYSVTDNDPVEVCGEDLAYVIYTSGSTGQPKGCMVEHGGVVNRLHWMWDHYGFTPDDVVLQKTTYTFDVSVGEIFMPLCFGCRLVLCSDGDVYSPERLCSLIASEGVSYIHFVPGMFDIFMEEVFSSGRQGSLSSLKRIITSGEALSVHSVNKWYEGFSVPVYNLYGPTEASIDVTHFDTVAGLGVIPIGRPVWNTQLYVLDGNMHPSGIGISGELYIGGVQVARGYLNRTDLTGERFVADPFIPGGRLYRTGDLGYWRADGNLVYQGRSDNQVKIRGYRIELGEVEQALSSLSGIQSAAVQSFVDSSGQGYLAGYVVSDTPQASSFLREQLQRQLPDYMIPGYFVQLSSLPLTENGKLDRRSLVAPDGSTGLSSSVEYVAPRNAIEEQLTAMFSRIFNKTVVGIRDSFFELGGDSIKAILLSSRLKQQGYTLKIGSILMYPVISDMALHVTETTRLIDQGIVEGEVPLTAVQHWFLESGMDDLSHYNQSVLLSGRMVSAHRLHECLDQLTRHHDALRMIYQEQDNVWHQYNRGLQSGTLYELSEHDLIGLSDDGISEMGILCDQLQGSMSLSKGPLLKCGLFHLSDGDRVLLTIHHLVVDGVSWRILLEDLSTLYDQLSSGVACELPEKSDSFRHWSLSLQDYALGSPALSELSYWRSMVSLSGITGSGSGTISGIRSSESFSLDEQETILLQTRVNRVYHTEINDILLAALGKGFHDALGHERLLVSLEGHGREDILSDITTDRTVGWFTSIYPVLLSTGCTIDLLDHLVEVKEELRGVPRKGIGYGLLRYLSDEGRAVLSEIRESDVMFNYLGDFGSGVMTSSGSGVFSYSDEYKGRSVSTANRERTGITITGMIVGGSLHIEINYDTGLYSSSEMDVLSSRYRHYIQELIGLLQFDQQSYLTPSDVTYKGLSTLELKALNSDGGLEDVYGLSPLQEGIYYHWLSSPGTTAYVIQTSYRILGHLDVGVLEQSYSELIGRHSILRTSFHHEYGKDNLQVVRRDVSADFSYMELREWDDALIESYKLSDRVRGFELSSGSQMRLSILGLGDQGYEFIWSHHHILMDGWCSSILINEFYTIYRSLLKGEQALLGRVYPYRDYIKWLSSVSEETSLRYWREYLADYTIKAELPLKNKLKESTTYVLEEKILKIEAPLMAAIGLLCKTLKVTESTFIQSVWGYLLSRYNHTRDVVFGAVVSGRGVDVEGIESMIGLLINTIPVRVQYDTETTVKTLLETMQGIAISGMPHHAVSLSDIQSASAVSKGLFDHIIVYENYLVQKLIIETELNEFKLLTSDTIDHTHYDFNITIAADETMDIKFSYNAAVYAKDTVDRISDHLNRIINDFVDTPDAKLDDLEYVGAEERDQLVRVFNSTVHVSDMATDLVSLFREQVLLRGSTVALIHEGRSLSYQELETETNRLGSYLRTVHGVGRGDLISVVLPRSEWMIISLLSIIKLGCAYVPVDPSNPSDRISYILSDSGCSCVIDSDFLSSYLSVRDTYSVTDNDPVEVCGEDLAYVIYTSGSTGQPKGCMVEHGGVVNRLHWMWDHYGFTPDDVVLQKTTYTFDVSVGEIFMPLCFGCRLVLCSDGDVYSPERLCSLIASEGVSYIHFVPGMFDIFMEEVFSSGRQGSLSSLKRIITSGEALSVHSVNKWYEGFSVPVYNLYGPTEASIDVTHFDTVAGLGVIPIGRPVWNTQLYVLDGNMHPSGIGISGELYIGGVQVARGYLNRTDLTGERFVADPFIPGGRLYRTGDLGYWRADGNLVYQGRSDNQVKIRGYRIELGEVEQALSSLSGIQSAAVQSFVDSSGQGYLAGYVVSDTPQASSFLREQLQRQLPDYMIPGYFVQLSSLPLTENGKLDRRSLVAPDGSTGLSSSVEYVAPRNAIEEQLTAIWGEVLRINRPISVIENLFNIGLNSLLVIKTSSSIKKHFNVQINVSDVYKISSIHELATVIESLIWLRDSDHINTHRSEEFTI